jgi:shikimate 5-dehydrogenase
MPGNVTFIGVTTASSAIMRVFPEWARYLGTGEVTLTGQDLPLRAEPRRYRDVVAAIRSGAGELGALVTSHKIDVYRTCRDMFDEVDGYADLCGEVSCLAKRDGMLLAQAKDPVASGRALDEFVAPGYFADTGAHALLLGAGGSGLAISLHLMTGRPPGDRPARIIAADLDPARLAAMRAVHGRLGGGPDAAVPVGYARSAGPADGDALLAALPPGSLVVNGTGAGKDTPGSPVSDAGAFPSGARVWDLNYRGALDFLRQARRQRDAAELAIHDGWRYFVHGWACALEEILGLPIGPGRLEELSRIALAIRSGAAAPDQAADRAAGRARDQAADR